MIERTNMDRNADGIVASDLPKGIALLSDLAKNMNSVTAGLLVLKEKIENNKLNTEKGVSLLELKNQTFLMYMSNLSYVTLQKLRGSKLDGDPCIDRLVESRVVLERIRPLEDKLKYQIDKYVKIATDGAINTDDPSRLKGNLDNIGSSSDEEEESQVKKSVDEPSDDEETRTYKIPKISQTPYEDKNKEKKIEKARKRTLNSSMLKEALMEHTDDPEVVYNMDAIQQKGAKKRREIEAYEERNMTRVPLTKRERRTINSMPTMGKLGSEFLGFSDMNALEDDYDPEEQPAKKRKTGKIRKGKSKGKKGSKKKKH